MAWRVSHFSEPFARRVNDILHEVLPPTWFYKHEIYEVPGLLTALLVTYDNVTDDAIEVHGDTLWDEFLQRMSRVKPDWSGFDRANIERLRPDQGIGGAEGRTYYAIRSGQDPQYWTAEEGQKFIVNLLLNTATSQPQMIQWRVEHLAETVPVGREFFQAFEDSVRIVFNFLFKSHLQPGQAQVRTDPEDEGLEIRDLVFANSSESGFWKDLKNKYSVSQVVVDAKNTEQLTRDDLRQLYCYLKPALGYWGFIVCRARQPDRIHAFNRTLFQNFAQKRGLLILYDDDMRRMVSIALRGHDASDYLRDKMSEFVRRV